MGVAKKVEDMRDDRKNVFDMGGSRVDDDHLLSMYIDNELDAEQTIAFVSRLNSEPALRTRLTQLEENDGLIKQVYTQSAASIPNHVAALISADNVTLLRPVRQWRRWTTAAVAASCAAVVAMVLNTNQIAVFHPMTIDAKMAHALESSPSRASGWEILDDDRTFRSVLTFPAADGKWCREFLLTHRESNWRGVACRDGSNWVNQVVGSEMFLNQETQYRPAGADDSQNVARFIDETATDIALGPQQEAALIQSGW
jgi:hypothetical protein